MTITKTLQSFISEHKIQVERVERVKSKDSPEMDHWKLVLVGMFHKGARRTLTTHFSMGFAHKGRKPEADEVLDCLLSDASGIDASFEEWASDLGYDTDSRKAEKLYEACQLSAERLKSFLGETYLEALDLERL